MPLPQGSRVPVKQTTGGAFSAAFYSGAIAPGLTCAPGAFAVGSDVFVASGPGRLDKIVVHVHSAQSGQLNTIPFYDAHQPVSGGPIYASGHRPVASIPAVLNVIGGSPASGQVGLPVGFAGEPYTEASFFSSGLCFNSRSGQPGFTVFWTAEPQL